MTTDRERLLERIAKVLAMTASPSENEAAVAWTRVHTMLAEHNMTMADVGQRDLIGCDMHSKTDAKPWRRSLATQVGKMYFCLYFFSQVPYEEGDAHYFVGEKHNTTVARMMFDYITGMIERLAQQGADRETNTARTAANYKETFIDACALRVCARIQARIDAARNGEASDWCGNTLPVLASEYDRKQIEARNFMDQQFNFSQEAKTMLPVKAVVKNQKAAIAGYKAGDNVGLEHQVSQASQKRLV